MICSRLFGYLDVIYCIGLGAGGQGGLGQILGPGGHQETSSTFSFGLNHTNKVLSNYLNVVI